MARMRKDAASFAGVWSPDLEWYAKAVGALQKQPVATRTSWRYLGAIHGFNQKTWIDNHVITNADPLENVRGTAASGVLKVRLGVPAIGATPASAPETVKSVALFGLGRTSTADDGHGGNGISVAIDIAQIARKLAQQSGATLDRLVVHLDQPDGAHPITVERDSASPARRHRGPA